MKWWAAFAVAAGGCYKIPPPLGSDGGNCTNPPQAALPGGAVSFEEVGVSPLTCPVGAQGALTLVAPRYRVAISPQGFISSLQISTDTFHEFLFHDHHSCVGEDGAGNAVYPAASANFDVPAVTAHVQVLANGPAMAQAQVDWVLAYSCADAQTASGRTTWTFYPNGRFVRHDANVVPGQSLSSASSCGGLAPCPSSSSFYFTSYLALDATQLDQYGTDSTVTYPLPSLPAEVDGNASSAIQCAAHSASMSGPLIAAIPYGSSGDHTRIRFNPNGNDGNPEIAFTYDWGFMQGSLPATPRDATISYFWSDHYQCDSDLDAFATSFQNPPNLSGIRFDHTTGTYVDDTDHSGPFDVTYTALDADTIQGVSIELQTDRASFQLFATAPATPDAMLGEANDYFVQQIDSNHVLFWIVNQIANSNGIRIIGS
jgi:hypothetical protein